MQLKGIPLSLNTYESPEILTNKYFQEFKILDFDKIYLPESMEAFTDQNKLDVKEFLIDDNRGAVSPTPLITMDDTEFYLSVKGIGSTTNPFSHQLFGKTEISNFLKDSKLKDKIVNSEMKSSRYITGELWLRGSPYGGQGLQHATTSLKISEMADLTSIHGFRIAPLVNIVQLPESLE